MGPRWHGLADLAFVVAFVLLPTLLDLDRSAALLSYGLAGGLILVAGFSAPFPRGFAALLPSEVHGLAEFITGIALIIVGVLAFDGAERIYFLAGGVLLLVLYKATSYRKGYHPALRPASDADASR